MKTKILITGLLICIVCIGYSQISITLQPDSVLGKDAYIHDLDIYENLGNHQDFAGIAWTCFGPLCVARNLIDFDLSVIPVNSVINSAILSLFHNPTTPNIGHSTLSGSNEAVLQRITSDWDEHKVTWDNQPNTTTQNEVILPQSTNQNEDYPEIDVTAIIQDIINNPPTGFGFMLRLRNENYYRSMIFASSDHSDSTLHPKLVIIYTDNTGIQNNESLSDFVKVYPNPFSDRTTIKFDNKKREDFTLKLYDIYGQQVYAITGINTGEIEIMKNGLSSGLYLLQLYSNNQLYGSMKILLE